MIPTTAIAEAVAAVAEQDKSGLRIVCMFCGADQPLSNPSAVRTSHGVCKPMCDAGIKLGWGKYQKEQK